MRKRKNLKDKSFQATVSTDAKEIKVAANDEWGLIAEIISAVSKLTGKKPEELLHFTTN